MFFCYNFIVLGRGQKSSPFPASGASPQHLKPLPRRTHAHTEVQGACCRLSGEALAGENKTGIDPATVATICREIGIRFETGRRNGPCDCGAIFFAGFPALPRAWNACLPTTWACLPPCSTPRRVRHAGKAGLSHACAFGHYHAGSVRALYSPPRPAPHGKSAGWLFAPRVRANSLLYYRHHRRPARAWN